MTITELMNQAIRDHFEIPGDVIRQASLASWDLHYGPSGGGLEDEDENGEPVYLGFTEACSKVSEWCDDNLSEVWYDIQSGEVLLSEPKGYYDGEDIDDNGNSPWVEPDWEDFIHFELDDVKRVVFDKELAAHI